MDLTLKKCIPCSGGIPPMDDQQITKFLKSLGNNWQINNQKHLFKSFKFQNYIQAVEFTNKITKTIILSLFVGRIFIFISNLFNFYLTLFFYQCINFT